MAADAGARAADGSVKDSQGAVGWPDTVSAYTTPALPPDTYATQPPAHGRGVGLDTVLPRSACYRAAGRGHVTAAAVLAASSLDSAETDTLTRSRKELAQAACQDAEPTQRSMSRGSQAELSHAPSFPSSAPTAARRSSASTPFEPCTLLALAKLNIDR